MGLALLGLIMSSAGCRFPGTVRPSVKVGLVAPFEGRYRYVGYDVIYSVRLALRKANAAGGVAGYTVELAAYDDRADSVLAAEQARKLDADPAVVAAIGHFCERTTVSALAAYAGADIPLIAPAVLDPALTSSQADVYRLGPAAEVLATALSQHLKESARYQTALVTDGAALGAALQRVARQSSLQIRPIVSPQNRDWLNDVLASGAQVVICDADPVTAGEVASALRAAGWEGDFLGGPALAAGDFAAVAGQAAEGAMFITPYPLPADVAGSVGFAAAYRAVSNGVPPGPLALPAYEAARLLLQALERDIAAHGQPTRQGVGAALEATEREGLLGRITFDAAHNWADAPLWWYRLGAKGNAHPIDAH